MNRIVGFINTKSRMATVAVLFAVSFVYGQDLPQKLVNIDHYTSKAQKDWKIPGMALAVVKDGTVVFAKGYGVRKLGSDEAVNADTTFAIASNSKAFTTASIALLIEQGKIGDWDDKVQQYLPEFQLYDPYVSSEVTIRDIVSHRVGLDTFSGDLLWYDTTYTPDEIINRLKYLKPVRGFRAGFGYQNLMFITAGKLIERVSGKSWGDFVKQNLLKPLKMNRTTTTVKDLDSNAAFPHNESGGNGLRVLPHGNVDNAKSAAALNSSVNDIANWLIMQADGGRFEGKQIVSEKEIWEMHQPAVILPISKASSEFIPSRHFDAYGLGWNIFDYKGKKVLNHGGGLDGMISKTVFVPEEKLGAVILTNSEQSVPSILMYYVLDQFLGGEQRDWSAEYQKFSKNAEAREAANLKKLEEKRVKNTNTTRESDAYSGTYGGELYGNATVTNESGKLVLRLLPAPDFVADLEHWQYNTFRLHWRPSVAYNFPPGFITFQIDKNGTPSKFSIDQPNNDFWFYELEFKRRK
ncbi:MAG: serine hydrolase [Pyrinomonadaceae bacterium]